MEQPNNPEEGLRGDSLARLPLLVELFYGFAIANGLSDALKSTIDKQSPFQWFFLIVALLLGLGDWLGYHVHVSKIPYRSLTRLILDLLFPILVYCLLLAPTLTPTESGLSYIAPIVFAYFVLAIVYAFLLRREDPHADPVLTRTIAISLGASTIAIIINFALRSRPWSTFLVEALSALAVTLWVIYNMRLVHRTMHAPDRFRKVQLKPDVLADEPSDPAIKNAGEGCSANPKTDDSTTSLNTF